MAVETSAALLAERDRQRRLRQRYVMRRRLGEVLRYLTIIVSLVVILFPIYWMVLSTFQPERYELTWPPPLFFKGFDLDAIRTAFAQNPIGNWLGHSFLVSAIAVVVTTLFAIPGAFLLSRLRWRGASIFGFCLLFTQMMPGAIIIVPEIQIYRTLDLQNNLYALSLIYAAFTTPLGCWVLKASFDSVPGEVFDASLVDGCSPMQSLFHILVPLSRPGLTAVAIVAFFGSWNDYLFASAFITDHSLYTAGEGLASFITAGNTALYQLIGAGAVFAVIPIVMFLVVQRQVVSGLTAGAVKG